MSIVYETKKYLLKMGADMVGFADISKLPAECTNSMKSAISIIVSLDPGIISEIATGPTINYHKEYERVNGLLKQLSQQASEFMKEHGYEAIPLEPTIVGIDNKNLSANFQHKTAAVLSGIGWIGKSALLVTKKFGSAIRLVTVLTNISLNGNTTIHKNLCGNCTECMKVCPGNAIKGFNWVMGTNRDHIYDAFACRKAAVKKAEAIGINDSVCGMCIAVCPWTRRYIERSISREGTII